MRPYEQKLIDGLHALGTKVRLHICGNTRRILTPIGTLGCELIDIDYFVPMDMARRDIGPGPALAGNLNPVAEVRNATPEAVTAATARCHAQAGPRYVVAAGCEIPRDTPEANVRALHDYAKQAYQD